MAARLASGMPIDEMLGLITRLPMTFLFPYA